MARLIEKRAVSERKVGNNSSYAPILSRKKARQSALKALANQAFEGSFAPIRHFMIEKQNLPPKQRDQVIDILEQTDHQRKGLKK